MDYSFSEHIKKAKTIVRIEVQEMLKKDSFCYVGSIANKDEEIYEDVEHRKKSGWLKRRLIFGVLCDGWMSTRLNEILYRTIIRPAMTYGVESRPIKKQRMLKMDIAEIRILIWMCGKNRKDKVKMSAFESHRGSINR